MNRIAILEGMLFILGDEGTTIDKISEILEIGKEETIKLLNELKDIYFDESRGITIKFLGNNIKLTTKNEHKEYYTKLLESENNNVLSPQALEILAIIAYNEPISRVEIDEIRGISSSYVVRKLAARGLIRECGKSTLPGKPTLYKTTNEFLDCFGLTSLDELPKIEIKKEEENDREIDLFKTKYKDNLDF